MCFTLELLLLIYTYIILFINFFSMCILLITILIIDKQVRIIYVLFAQTMCKEFLYKRCFSFCKLMQI